MTLRYTKPADAWVEALPLGNGRLSMMVYGGTDCSRIRLGEETLWDGRFDPYADNPLCAEHLDEIRRAIFAGDYKTGERLTQKYMVCRGKGSNYASGYGHNYGSFQHGGDFCLCFDEGTETRDYERTLDLTTGVCRVLWKKDGVSFRMTAYTDYVTGCGMVRYEASEAISATLRYEREGASVSYEPGLVAVRQAFPNSQAFGVYGKVLCDGGMTADIDGIRVTDAEWLELRFDLRTTYVKPGADGLPLPSNDPELALDGAKSQVEALRGDFDALCDASSAVLSALMNRVEIQLPAEGCPEELTTDARILRMREGKDDNGLLLTYFDFGRYLLISSSYRCVLPANLQGVWTGDYDTIWSADYHININLQMNYWLAETANLPELTKPLLDYIRFLSIHGRRTAKIQYHADGWVAHTITNPWGFTAPGEGASWGSFMCAGAWCCQHIKERYLFSGDAKVYEENYDILKGCCQFFLDFLTEDPRTGCLVTCPSNSPENRFITPEGNFAICAGPTMDNEIIRELFDTTVEAARLLHIDEDFAARLTEAKGRLAPISLGKHGQIMEWSEDFEENEPGHRHISHLFALHPSAQITKNTPELMEGARVTLRRRLENGGGHTGWSRAWVTLFFARLGEGDICLENLNALLGRCTLPNMFDTHPPFQIDGNFGGAAALPEMLLQSHDGSITLLPALPEKWHTGSFRGLAARGGYTVDCSWEKGKITGYSVYDRDGRVCPIPVTFGI